MQCLACGAEMQLMHVVQDHTMPIAGYEHHTFMCSACGDIERRLVFTRNIVQSHTEEPVPVHTAPTTASGTLRRLFAKLRGGQNSASRSAELLSVPTTPPTSAPVEPVSLPTAPPTSAPPAEPEPVPTTAHTSVPSEADNGLDEIEALLRRAIEMVRAPTPRSQPTGSLTEGRPGTPAELGGSVPVHSAPPTSVSSEPDTDLDGGEALRKRAIEMDRGPTPRSQPTGSLTEGRPGTPAELGSSVPVDSAPPTSVSSEPDTDLDEGEALLRRAIEMVRAPTPRSQPTGSLTEGRPGTPAELGGSVPVHSAPPTSVSSEPDTDLDGGEALLRRAIEMVRGPTPRSQPTGSLTEGRPGTPAELGSSVPVDSAPPTSVSSEPDTDLDEGEALL